MSLSAKLWSGEQQIDTNCDEKDNRHEPNETVTFHYPDLHEKFPFRWLGHFEWIKSKIPLFFLRGEGEF